MCVYVCIHTHLQTQMDIEAQIKSPVWICIYKVTGLHTCSWGLNNKMKSLVRVHGKEKH